MYICHSSSLTTGIASATAHHLGSRPWHCYGCVDRCAAGPHRTFSNCVRTHKYNMYVCMCVCMYVCMCASMLVCDTYDMYICIWYIYDIWYMYIYTYLAPSRNRKDEFWGPNFSRIVLQYILFGAAIFAHVYLYGCIATWEDPQSNLSCNQGPAIIRSNKSGHIQVSSWFRISN